jgi:hypothetical protein
MFIDEVCVSPPVFISDVDLAAVILLKRSRYLSERISIYESVVSVRCRLNLVKDSSMYMVDDELALMKAEYSEIMKCLTIAD